MSSRRKLATTPLGLVRVRAFVMRLTKSEEDVVFRLWVDGNVPERARKYIPDNLVRLSGKCFVRILNVKKHVATLGLYETKENAMADVRCIELVAPPVTASTISHLGIKYVDGQGWVEVSPPLSDGSNKLQEEGGSEGESEDESLGEEVQGQERDSSEGDAGRRAVAQSGPLGARGIPEGSPALYMGAGLREVAEATGILDEGALGRLAAHGLAGKGDLQLLKEQGRGFAQALAAAASLSVCDAQRLKAYAGAGGVESDGLGQNASKGVANDGFGQAAACVAMGARGGSRTVGGRGGSRPPRRASAEAKKKISFLEAFNSSEADACSPTSEEERAVSAKGRDLRVPGSGASEPPFTISTPGAVATRWASAGAVSCSSELAAPMRRAGSRDTVGDGGIGRRADTGVASCGASGGVAARGAAGAGEAARLMEGVPQSRWESLGQECLEWLAPALLKRAPRELEMRRPVKQLELWLRAAAAKGATVAVVPPGDEDAVLDAVQELCACLELEEVRPPQSEAPPQQQGWAGGGAAFPTMVVSSGGGTASAERLDDERAMMEAVMFVSKDGGVGERLSEVARKDPSDSSVMRAAAALGEVDKLRPILYMGAGSIQMPAGMLATPSIMLLISDGKRLRALVLGQLAEHMRGFLPSAGTKAETASNLAEGVWTGALVSKFKLQEIFQPKGGSMLLAGGGRRLRSSRSRSCFREDSTF